MQVQVAVLGAGPTGLGASWRLAHHFHATPSSAGAPLPFLLIDESETPGGRAASHTTPEGFVFDYGGHVLFPHHEYTTFTDLLDETVPSWHSSTPVTAVWFAGRLIPKPLQRNIHRLPLPMMVGCLLGLLQRRPLEQSLTEPNLQQYLEEQFGKPLTKHVMGPLNKKMWAHPPQSLGSSWSAFHSGSKEKNIPDVAIWKIIRNFLLRRDDPGWTADTRVRYPAKGGTGAIWTRIFDALPAGSTRLASRVVEVDPDKKPCFWKMAPRCTMSA